MPRSTPIVPEGWPPWLAVALWRTIDPPKRARQADRDRADAALSRALAAGRLSDLTSDRVQAALAMLRDAGRSLTTCNHHRAAIRWFSRWCHNTRRSRDDALRASRL